MNNKTALNVASAMRYLIQQKYMSPSQAVAKNLIEELWSEIATADTYGKGDLLFVSAIRECEKRGTGDYWFKRVRTLILAGTMENGLIKSVK